MEIFVNCVGIRMIVRHVLEQDMLSRWRVPYAKEQVRNYET